MRGEHAGRGVAVVDPELAAGAVAIGVDRGLRHAELTCDLFGAEVLVHETQAFPLASGQQLYPVAGQVVGFPHKTHS